MPYCAQLPANPAIRRILIIKWSAMGDVIIASALFEDIARAFPGREIHLDTQPAWQPLFAHDPRFQQILVVDWRNRRQRLQSDGDLAPAGAGAALRPGHRSPVQ
jgi:heptosyltransferase-2